MPPIFVNARELADRLDVDYRKVLTWVRREKIPHIRGGNRQLLFNLDAVIRSLRNKTVAASSPTARQGGDR
jgi:excisionase family DNA binding protein